MKDFHDLALALRLTAKHLARNFDCTNIDNVHKLNLMANELEAMRIVKTNAEVVKESLEHVLLTTVWGTKTGRTSSNRSNMSDVARDPININVITHKIRKINDIPTPEMIRGKQAAMVLQDEIAARKVAASPALGTLYYGISNPFSGAPV